MPKMENMTLLKIFELADIYSTVITNKKIQGRLVGYSATSADRKKEKKKRKRDRNAAGTNHAILMCWYFSSSQAVRFEWAERQNISGRAR